MEAMKKIGLFVLVTVCAALALTACQKEHGEQPSAGNLVAVSLRAGNPEIATQTRTEPVEGLIEPTTRTELVGLTPYWSVGDRIGVNTLGRNTNYEFSNTAREAAEHAVFNGMATTLTPSVAYHPFTDNGVGSVGDRTGAMVDLPAEQNPTTTSFDGKADILVSKPFGFASDGTRVADLVFRRLTALVKVVLKDRSTGRELTGEELSSLSITTDGENTLAGRVLVDLRDYTLQAPYENASNTVTATYTPATTYPIDDTAATFLSVFPRPLAAGSTLTIRAETAGHTITKAITLPVQIDLPAGKITTLNIGVTDAELTQKPANGTGPRYELPLAGKVKWIANDWSSILSYNNMNWAIAKISGTDAAGPGTWEVSGRGLVFGRSNAAIGSMSVTGTNYQTFVDAQTFGDSKSAGISSIDVKACAMKGNTLTIGVTVGGVAMTCTNPTHTIGGSNAASVITCNFTGDIPLAGDIVITYTLATPGILFLNNIVINDSKD